MYIYTKKRGRGKKLQQMGVDLSVSKSTKRFYKICKKTKKQTRENIKKQL